MTFVVGYALTNIQSVGEKHAFWKDLERVVKEVPEHGKLFVLMDANARTGIREGESWGMRSVKFSVPTAEIHSTIMVSDSFRFSVNHGLALLKTFFSTADNAISHTFKGRGKKRIDYILTRQQDRKIMRDVTVHPQPSSLPISDHNTVTAHLKLLGRFARSRPVREAKGPPPIDRR